MGRTCPGSLAQFKWNKALLIIQGASARTCMYVSPGDPHCTHLSRYHTGSPCLPGSSGFGLGLDFLQQPAQRTLLLVAGRVWPGKLPGVVILLSLEPAQNTAHQAEDR